jgi:peptidyl-prolyl cis-trans isomerase C
MKRVVSLVAFLSGIVLCAQTPPAGPRKVAEPAPETVLATLGDGSKVTYAELKAVMTGMGGQGAQAAMRDPRAFVTQYALMRKLAQLAEQSKLDQASPTREVLAYQRQTMLVSAEINDAMNKVIVPPEDLKKHYEANKDRYTQVAVKAIYVAFYMGAGAEPGEGRLDEAQARAKIEKILADVRGGADFTEMVKKHSEDKTSAAKDGSFGNLRRGDNLPEAVRNAIFSLEQGQVSEPVRQANGFYLFRADRITQQPFEEVRNEIFETVKQARFREWMETTQNDLKVKFEYAPFFEQAPPAPPAK